MKRIVLFACIIILATSAILAESVAKGEGKFRQIQMVINQKTAFIDGKSVELETPPTIINGRTVVPLRFLQDNAMSDSTKINWEPTEKKITLSIPMESIDSEVYASMLREMDRLKVDNAKLKEELDRCKRGQLPPENRVLPITYGPKNGVKFIFKSMVKERDAIRCDLVVENISDTWCRFPASSTVMTLDGQEYKPVSVDPVFYERISAGKRIPGYIRFAVFPTTGTAEFKFVMHPQDTLKYFDFFIKVNLDQSIPSNAR